MPSTAEVRTIAAVRTILVARDRITVADTTLHRTVVITREKQTHITRMATTRIRIAPTATASTNRNSNKVESHFFMAWCTSRRCISSN